MFEQPDGLALHLSNISVAYQTPSGLQYVLNEINLSIEAGSFVAVVGENGSGKSTLAKVISGLLPVSKGHLSRTDGTHTAVDNTHAGYVFQNPDAQIIGERVAEDVAFGLENKGVPTEEMYPVVVNALQRVGLVERSASRVSTLSGGQKQLLCIADYVALSPGLIVFDEATSMLHPRARNRVLETVCDIRNAGLTVVWVTQWMEELALANRVIALAKGSVVFDGTPESFFYDTSGTHGNRQVSPCEQLGFDPPFAVQVGRRLRELQVPMDKLPLSPDSLAEVCKA